MTRSPCCPRCRSSDPQIARSDCYNPWHHGTEVHLQRETTAAACGAPIDDPPSQLAVSLEFVSCPACIVSVPACDRGHPAPTCADPGCYREIAARKADEILPGLGDLVRKGNLDPDPPSTNEKIADVGPKLWRDSATIIAPTNPVEAWRVASVSERSDVPHATVKRHQELTDDEVGQAPLEDLRAAYRSLRDHHVAETTALVGRRDDLTRRRDDLLAKNQTILAESQRLIATASTFMERDEKVIDDLTKENARLSEIIDFMRNRYSPFGGRSCALCVYEEGRFIRSCALHRWEKDVEQRQPEDEQP